MKSILFKILFLTLVIFMTGCVSLRSVSMTQIPKKRGRPVMASADRTIFLGFNFDNDYVDTVVDQLKSQCKGGMVTGILTKDQLTNYFLFFVYNREIVAKGYCVKS
jgi:hypothetical protein